jgi:hypothetical protein
MTTTAATHDEAASTCTRYWRDARTHSVHDPVDWKYHHLGGYEPADVLPPNHGQL